MHEKLIEAAIAICICISWLLFDFINLKTFEFLQIKPFLYAIYWLAGFRILAIILFGYVGLIGICLGYALSAIYLRGFNYEDALWLSLLSSCAAMISYKLWQKITGHTNKFISVSFLALFYLITLNAVFTALFRFIYLSYSNKVFSTEILFGTFAANVSGAIIFLYIIKIVACNIHQLKKRH